MAFAETAKLVVNLSMAGNFQSQLKTSQRALGTFDAKLSGTSTRAFRAGQQIGTGIKNGLKIAAVGVGILAAQVVAGLRSLASLEQAQAQTRAALRSTKSVAGQTAQSIRALAEKFEGLNATIDDKVIQSSENLLLSFTNIRGKAFEPALAAILDLNTALGKGEGGLAGTTKIVAKALNDPIKGLTALGRVGITFTKDQVKRIKQAIKEKDTYKAQAIILEELGKRFGGRFKAQGQTAEGAIAGIKDAVEDLQKALAQALFPTIQRVLPKIREFLSSPAVIDGARKLGEAIAGLFSDENINHGVDILKSGFETAKTVAPIVAEAAKATAGFVKTAVGLFNSLPDGLKALIVGGVAVNKITGGLVTNIVAGIGGELFKKGGSPANPLWVASVNGGIGGGGGIGGAAGAAAGIGTGAALVTVAAAVAASVIATMPFADKNNALKSQGLSPAEIAARKFAASDAAGQQWAIKHGYGPTGAKLSNAKPAMGPASVINAGGDTRSESRRLDMIRSATTIGSNRVRSAVLTSGSKTTRAAQDGAHAQNRTRAALSAKLEKVRAAAERDRILRVTIPVKTFISGRLLASALGRYQPSSLTHHAGNGGA